MMYLQCLSLGSWGRDLVPAALSLYPPDDAERILETSSSWPEKKRERVMICAK